MRIALRDYKYVCAHMLHPNLITHTLHVGMLSTALGNKQYRLCSYDGRSLFQGHGLHPNLDSLHKSDGGFGLFFLFWSLHDKSMPKTCFLRSGEVTVYLVGEDAAIDAGEL